MTTFFKANTAYFAASLYDHLITNFIKLNLKVDVVTARVTGTPFGGIINFLIGEYWVYNSTNVSSAAQAKRYLLTWTGKLMMSAIGIFLLTKLLGSHYIIAKISTSIIVVLSYNYHVQKKIVFKKFVTT